MKSAASIICAVICAIAWVGNGFAQDPKSTMAFFDMQKFLGKSIKAKEVQKKLTDLLETKKTALENKKKELISLSEELQKQGPMLKEEKRTEKLKEIKMKEWEFQLAEKEAQNSVQSEEREFMEALQRDITKIISKMRAEMNLAFVFNSMMLVSADDTLDLTEEVIKIYDADAEVGKPVAKPKPIPATKPKPADGKK